MGGQPWAELELHGRPWGAHRRGERGGRRRGEGGAARGQHGGLLGGAMGRGCGRCSLLVLLPFALCCYVSSVREEENSRKEEGERRRKRKENEKNKKNSKLENFWGEK
jgi:hypothetical protein